jgi:hypothetical protein
MWIPTFMCIPQFSYEARLEPSQTSASTRIYETIPRTLCFSFGQSLTTFSPKVSLNWQCVTCRFDVITTNRNWPKCNHFICGYMQLLVICNYIWTFLQLFLVLVIFAITLQLVCDYFGVHPSMWKTFSLFFIQEE